MKKLFLIMVVVIVTSASAAMSMSYEEALKVKVNTDDFIGFFTTSFVGDKKITKVGGAFTETSGFIGPITHTVKLSEKIDFTIKDLEKAIALKALLKGYNAMIGIQIEVSHNFDSFNGQTINGKDGVLALSVVYTGTLVLVE